MKRFGLLLLPLLISVTNGQAQCPGNLSMQWEWEDQFPTGISALSMEPDQLGRKYLYVAANELGLRVYDTGPSPYLVTALDTVDLQMRVMSLSQRGSFLYVCIGSHFGESTDPPGLAVVDVTNPASPIVRDVWIGNSGNGAGIVRVEGSTAYLGAMSEGLVLLDVSDPDNIQFISQIIPPITYPVASNDPEKVNARGLAVLNGIVYLAYDAGGLRIIDCTNPVQPVERGRYANPVTFVPNNWPRAYNNVLLRDALAYVAVDYCGLEILSVADTGNIQLISHWNPHNCPTGQWWDAPIHANEMALLPDCDLLFMSTGKSEMMVIDVSDPAQPDSCSMYGSLSDTTGSWGIAMSESHIFLSYTYVPTWIPQILVPFYSTWSGVKQLGYQAVCSLQNAPETFRHLKIYPNPSHTSLQVENPTAKAMHLQMIDPMGHVVEEYEVQGNGRQVIALERMPAGLYVLLGRSAGQSWTGKLLVEKF